jgi:hypothetical protein
MFVAVMPQDKLPRVRLNVLQHMFTKYDCFAYQKEFRAVLSIGDDNMPQRFDFELGSLQDICRLLSSQQTPRP